MPWIQPDNPFNNLTPPSATPRSLRPRRSMEDILFMFQTLPIPQAMEMFHEALMLKMTMEQERTKREAIQAQRDITLRFIDSGAEEAKAIIEKEYQERAEFLRIHGELMKTLIEHGQADAALEVSKILLERAADRSLLHQIIAFRNQAASVGHIRLRVVEPPH